jgi:hypothetical protein
MRAVRAGIGAAVAAASALAAAGGSARGDVVVIGPAHDNTIFDTATDTESNGIGDSIFAGRTASNSGGIRQRGLIRFDIAAAIPAGSTITSVTLRLVCNQTSAGAQTVSLHRLNAAWGEAGSEATGGSGAPAFPGDATWQHTFFDAQFWAAPGGDFQAAASASRSVGSEGAYTWATTAALVADVQGWLGSPAANFGWLVRGNEAVVHTSKRFTSRHSFFSDDHPRLTIEFNPPPPTPGDTDLDGDVDVTDLLTLLSEWGACDFPCTPGAENPACAADFNNDCAVDVSDLLALLANWSG